MKLKRWLLLSGSIVFSGFGIAVIFVIINMLTASGAGIANAFYQMPQNFVTGCMLVCAIMSVTVYKVYLPMCLSMGSRRLDAFVGLQIMSKLPAVAATVLSAVFCLIFKNDSTSVFLAAWKLNLLEVIIAGSVGGIMGCVWVRFGRVGAVLTVVFMALIGGTIGFLSGFSASNHEMPQIINSWLGGSDNFILGFAAVAALLWLAEIIFSRNTLKNYEVKL